MSEEIGAYNIIYGVNSWGRVVYLRPFPSSDKIYIPEELNTKNGKRYWMSCSEDYTPKQITKKLYMRKIRLNNLSDKEQLYLASPESMKRDKILFIVGWG